MQTVLKSLNNVPGVMGCLLIDDDGHAIAHSLPAMFDTASLVEISFTIANNIEGLNETTGGVGFIDMRFDHGRIFIKKLQKHILLLLCETSINLQLLQISMNVANHKLEKLFAQMPKPAPIGVQPTVQAAPQAKPAAGTVRTNDKGIILTTKILDKTSNMSADSLISPQTATALSTFFRGIEYKSLHLHNIKNGKSVKTPVHTVTNDPNGTFDGFIGITPSIAGDLGAKDGDDLVVVVITKKGFFD